MKRQMNLLVVGITYDAMTRLISALSYGRMANNADKAEAVSTVKLTSGSEADEDDGDMVTVIFVCKQPSWHKEQGLLYFH
jgi:hypothetical protein